MKLEGVWFHHRVSQGYHFTIANVATLRGAWFYHRVSQGVPFYHSSVVEELLTVGRHHRSRALPGVTRFGALAFLKKSEPQRPKRARSNEDPNFKKKYATAV